MNKNVLAILVLVIPVLLVPSCHPGLVINLQNNSGRDLVVVSLNDKLEETKESVRRNRALRIGLFYKLRIEHKGGHWIYDSKTIPHEFYRKKNFMISAINLQIENDGAIYVLRPSDTGPVLTFPPQPAGFPLGPIANGGPRSERVSPDRIIFLCNGATPRISLRGVAF